MEILKNLVKKYSGYIEDLESRMPMYDLNLQMFDFFLLFALTLPLSVYIVYLMKKSEDKNEKVCQIINKERIKKIHDMQQQGEPESSPQQNCRDVNGCCPDDSKKDEIQDFGNHKLSDLEMSQSIIYFKAWKSQLAIFVLFYIYMGLFFPKHDYEISYITIAVEILIMVK